MRTAVFWLAVRGYGVSLGRMLPRRSVSSIPSLLTGLVFLLVLSPLLSLFGVFNRITLAVILVIGALTGAFPLLNGAREKLRKLRNAPWARNSVLAAVTLLLLLVNLYAALIPDDNPDALVAYAVAPDRWLDGGEIVYLEESIFSGFPWVGEVIASWPAALSLDPVDQLVLLQLFQLSMLLVTSLMAWWLICRDLRGLLACVSSCMATWILVEWACLPKFEMTVLFFTSVAMAALFVQHRNRSRHFSPVPFLAMGLALGTKVTVYILLPAFLFMVLLIPAYRKLSRLAPGLIIMLLPPAVFAVNTYLHTGTPFYPETVSILPPSEEYVSPDVDIISAHARASVQPGEQLVEREPDRFFTNLGRLVESWGLPVYLFIAGTFYTAVFRRKYTVLLPFSAMMVYAVSASVAFDPIRWGAKYAFLMTPALAAWGAYLCMRPLRNRYFLAAFTISLLAVPSFNGVFQRILEHPFPYRRDGSGLIPGVEVQPLQLWCNENLPEGSRLLSLWKRERYFCRHEILVIENHPIARRLFLAPSLEDEMALLDSMRIDFVYFETEDPMPGKLEGCIQFLDSGILEPVVEIEGFTLCRVIRKPAPPGGGLPDDPG
ncbi:MAG: hypothetical protein JXR55_08065, partial [Candidatus Fermentibacteraceae bacterium]|nr:hypothetical protein [Candidatus Fermentibacteraceae bacterium]